MKNARHQNPRSGFTLLELLMVVAILAVLVGLSTVVLLGVTDTAQEQAAVVAVSKVDGLLQQRIEAFNRAFDRPGSFRQRYVIVARTLLRGRGYFGVRPEVEEIIARKIAFRHHFPQRHEDLLRLGFADDGVTWATDFDQSDTLLAVGSRTLDSDHNRLADVVEATALPNASLPAEDSDAGDAAPETVSAELLYYMLVHSGSLGANAAVADQFEASEVADTDGDGLLEFVDSWGEPLRFYRWPTRLIDNDAPVPFQPILSNPNDPTDVYQLVDGSPVGTREVTGAASGERFVARRLIRGLPPSPSLLPNSVLPRDSLLVDPDDPIGRLYSEMEKFDGNNRHAQLAIFYNESNFHTPETWHTPLIVSAGPDGELGLYEPTDDTALGHLANYDGARVSELYDNITNRNRRAGGRQ